MTTTMRITGMTCGGCEANVIEALSGVDGVEDATADHEADEAVVEGDADPLDLIAAVPDQYEVESTA
ncbi:heavy-metal-associated domain-containing protein [Halobaculum magnesiiphilum]|uniref:Heavy-metal-associated domain-containing protein n=1 Tax=Halobaculum magnesiiphilum TaxID=1017351 RepID=A0A8T8WFP4_9EURY|nr:heavy-metal-associated domain-containing protein [Halobaculum magnesiiphilum]QZP38692.1 heavy-metal-associated domain-containing protein [Halobaculum magnesiiphilum]